MPLNWYVNPDLPNNVINQQPSSVIADIMGVMEHIITELEEEAYQSEIQYRNAQSKFKHPIKSAEGWRKLEFISSILGMIALGMIAPTLPQNWGGKGAEGKQKLAAQMTAWITTILIIITLWQFFTQYSKSVTMFPHYQGYASPCTHLAQYSEAPPTQIFL